MKKLIFGLLAIVMFSLIGNAQNLRADFLKGKTYDEVKKSYILLDKKTKIALWNEKISQVLTQKIDDNTKTNLISLQKEINNDVINNDNIRKIALNMANNMSEGQFEDIFMKLDDYSNKDYTYISVLDGIKNQINTQNVNFESGAVDKAKIPCNCDWTCSSMCSHPTKNCAMTSSGCGFMWAFECTTAC